MQILQDLGRRVRGQAQPAGMGIALLLAFLLAFLLPILDYAIRIAILGAGILVYFKKIKHPLIEKKCVRYPIYALSALSALTLIISIFPILIYYPASYDESICDNFAKIMVWSTSGDAICRASAIKLGAVRNHDVENCLSIPQNHLWNTRDECIVETGKEYLKSECTDLECKAQKIKEFSGYCTLSATCMLELAYSTSDVNICAQSIFDPEKTNLVMGEAYRVGPGCFALFMWNKLDKESACSKFGKETRAYEACQEGILIEQTLCKEGRNPVCQADLCWRDSSNLKIGSLVNCMQIVKSKSLDEATERMFD